MHCHSVEQRLCSTLEPVNGQLLFFVLCLHDNLFLRHGVNEQQLLEFDSFFIECVISFKGFFLHDRQLVHDLLEGRKVELPALGLDRLNTVQLAEILLQRFLDLPQRDCSSLNDIIVFTDRSVLLIALIHAFELPLYPIDPIQTHLDLFFPE